MKYILPQDKLDKFVEKYMEITYPVLYVKTDESGDHYFNERTGTTVFLIDRNHVFFDGKIMDEVCQIFGIEKSRNVLSGMGNWIENKYGIKGKGLY